MTGAGMAKSFRTRRAAMVVAVALPTAIGLDAQRQPGYISKVPRYEFADTLDEEETQFKTNPMLARFQESRQRVADDRHGPIYNYVNPEGRLNDPNGLSFWQGEWHLSCQAYAPADPRQHWWQASSANLVHWRDLPKAVYPNPEEAVSSFCST